MSDHIGAKIIFGIAVDANSDPARNFVLKCFEASNDVSDNFLSCFDCHYNCNVLFEDSENFHNDPKWVDSDYYSDNFMDLFEGKQYIPDTNISCFRHPCCLSKEWRGKFIIGVELIEFNDISIGPNGMDLPSLPGDKIQNIKSELTSFGFSDDTKLFCILNSCIKCT